MTDNRLSDQAQLRYEHPSGILVIMPEGTRALVLDTLLGVPPNNEFNKSQLAEWAGVSRDSVREHLELLESVGVVEHISDRNYRFNEESPVSQALMELDGAMNAEGPGVDEE